MTSSGINKGKSLLLRKICGVIVFLISFALAATGSLQAAPARSDSAPKLAVDSPVHDCGEIWSSDPIKHTFILENKGKSNLKIKRISAGHGVYVIRFDKVIVPGGKGEVVLEADTYRLNGEIQKEANVISNDPERPDFGLQIKGIVKTSLNISPKNHIRFRVNKGERKSWHFKINSPKKKDFKITQIKSRGKAIKVNYKLESSSKNNPEQGHVYDLTLTLPPETPVGNIRDVVKIYTDLGIYPGEISLMGKVEGPIRYKPTELTFTPVIDDGPVSRTVDFYGAEGKKIHIKDVKASHSELKWNIVPTENGNGCVLVAIWLGKPSKRIIKGNMKISTDCRKQAEIEIPYTVFPSVEKRGF